ncbi:DUF6338 family protein [Fuscovulum ytuae]|uniref:DUF6338 family protein n=1 Tax=Fuscovulum ytuae TaxID=3042299 RepID=A0ABY8Q7L5_9RHOB|nr:DUF6338 family protein [Fuscovulum sp. YMD61]WGV16275.1 DUF6338 family protein [Fuscovulum sp. YMD61]
MIEELATIENTSIVLFFVVPGLIILFTRAQFVTGGFKSTPDSILTYFVISSIYLAVCLPLIRWLELDPRSNHAAWLIFVFVLPVLVGSTLGLSVRRRWFLRLLHFFGMNLVDAIPTAWDWKLGNIAACYVIVTLKDETRFYGLLSRRSFISSDPSERDIYIEECFKFGEDGTWNRFPNEGVLIAANEVRTIEFFSATQEPVQ